VKEEKEENQSGPFLDLRRTFNNPPEESEKRGKERSKGHEESLRGHGKPEAIDVN